MTTDPVFPKLNATVHIYGQCHLLEAYRHRSQDPRYQVTLHMDHRPVFFTLIRTAVGHWVAQGDALPDWIGQHSADIVRALQDGH